MGFNGAAGCHVFGVEVEDDPLAVEAGEGDFCLVLRREGEVRRGLTDGGYGCVGGLDFVGDDGGYHQKNCDGGCCENPFHETTS